MMMMMMMMMIIIIIIKITTEKRHGSDYGLTIKLSLKCSTNLLFKSSKLEYLRGSKLNTNFTVTLAEPTSRYAGQNIK